MSNNDWAPTAGWKNLSLRAELLRRTRTFFDARGFLEVETPLLSADTVVDRHLDPLAVTLPDDPRRPNKGRRLWLQTSPEFAMKRLMSAGGEAIYQITRAFRAGEVGKLHNLEFTIVEWYRRGDDMQAGIKLLSNLSEALLDCDAAESLSYREAFLRHAEVDPLVADVDELASRAAGSGLSISNNDQQSDRDALLDYLLVARVAPALGIDRPAIVYDFPASQAALARIRDGDPPVAERFELFYRGIELANGYHELLDADELQNRNSAANAQRSADGKRELPTDSRLLKAMRHGLPPCSGVALGFDRLVMLAAGASSIDEVISFPMNRA